MSLFTNFEEAGQVLRLRKTRNFMRTLIWHNCARPWYVYAETFVPAFLELLILQNLPFPDDVFRDYAENLGRTAGRGRRGKRHGPRRQRASATPTRPQQVTRQGLITILKITQPLETLGYAFLLIATADNFFHRWQTLLENSTFCSDDLASGPCSRTDPPQFITPREFGQGFAFDEEEQCRGDWSSNAFAMTASKGMLSFHAALSGNARIAGIIDAQLVLIVQRNGVDLAEFASEPVTVEGRGAISLAVHGEFYASVVLDQVTIRWVLKGVTQLAAFEVTDGHVFGMRHTA